MASAALVWAGKSFASGVLSSAGGLAFERVMAVLGIPDTTQMVLDQLADIRAKLDSITQDIGIINARVSALAGQLNLVQLELDKRIEEKVIAEASSRIQTHFSGYIAPPPKPVLLKTEGKRVIPPITSLTELLNRKKDPAGLTDEAVNVFMENLLVTWDIPSAVNQIYSGLMGVSHDDGILRAWTDLFVAQMGIGSMDPRLFDFYESLEQRFLSLISVQLQGVYLVMLAKCNGAPAGTIPEEANHYLRNVFVPNVLMREIDLFLSSTEKLALSQGQWRSPHATRQNMMKDVRGRAVLVGGMGVPTDLTRILFRSELICRRLIETFRDMRNFPDPQKRGLGTLDAVGRTSGIYVHLLCRDKDVSGGEGPELTPWPGGGSKGRALPATGVRVPTWGDNKEGYTRLKEPEQSNLRLVRYFWPWSEIRGPAQIFADGKGFNETLLRPADFTSMGIDWTGISAGHTLDTDRLGPPALTADQAKASSWTVAPVAGLGKYTSGKLTTNLTDKPVLVPDKVSAFHRANISLEGKQTFDSTVVGTGTITATMICPLFSYEANQERKLKLYLWLSIQASRGLTKCLSFNMGSRVVVNLKTPQGVTQIYDSNTANGGKPVLWNEGRESGQLPQTSIEPTLTTTVAVGKTSGEERYTMEVIAQVLHQGYCPGATANISASVKELSLGWM